MSKVQEILKIFKQEAAGIVENSRANYQKDPQEEIVEQLRAQLSKLGEKTVHNAISEGIDNQLELVKGIQDIVLDNIYRLKHS